MAWRIEVAATAKRDIDLLFDHLAESYIAFGEAPPTAAERASARIEEILDTMDRIATAPQRGEPHDDLLPGLRHLTLERTIYWYQIDEGQQTLRILAIFYGGQDHVRQMLLRLLRDPVG